MSAFIVPKAHIDVLVLAGFQFNLAGPTDAALMHATGEGLWRENYASVNHLYGEHARALAYAMPTAEVLLDPVAVVKAIDCYTYQSCEHPGWKASRAAAYCDRLRDVAMRGLPLDTVAPTPGRYPVGWSAAPWVIDDIQQAAIEVQAAQAPGSDSELAVDEDGPR